MAVLPQIRKHVQRFIKNHQLNGFLQGFAIVCAKTLPAIMLLILYVDRYPNSDTEYETPKGYHHPENNYDDDEQPLYRDSRRSPKRRMLPATPQGTLTPCILQHEHVPYAYITIYVFIYFKQTKTHLAT